MADSERNTWLEMETREEHLAEDGDKRNTWLEMDPRYEYIFLVVIAAHRVNICKVNVGVFEKIISSLEASDVLETLAHTHTIVANRDPSLIRAALGTSCW